MSKYRGSQGNAVFGGILVGSPLVQGAVAQGATSATFDGVSLTGTVLPGDKFTVAGDAQEYEIVTGGEVSGNQIAVTFTPSVQEAAGWADNAAVTFVSNSVANVREWEATPSRPIIEATVMTDEAERRDLDVPKWSGRAVVFLDYGDAKQKAFIDQVTSNDPVSPISVTLVVAEAKNLWGTLVPANAGVTQRRGAYFEVTFDFEGEGVLNPDWN